MKFVFIYFILSYFDSSNQVLILFKVCSDFIVINTFSFHLFCCSYQLAFFNKSETQQWRNLNGTQRLLNLNVVYYKSICIVLLSTQTIATGRFGLFKSVFCQSQKCFYGLQNHSAIYQWWSWSFWCELFRFVDVSWTDSLPSLQYNGTDIVY